MKPYPVYKNSGLEWLGEIPSNWDIMLVRRLVKDHKQGYYTSQDYVDDGGTKLLRITDIDDFSNVDYSNSPKVALSDSEKQSFGLEIGDFVFARSGSIGRFGIIRQDTDAAFASYLIRFRFSEKVIIDFLKYYFLSHFFKNSLISDLHGGANQNIHAENIKNQFIALPSTSEQQAIADFLDCKTAQIAVLIEKKQRQIDLLQEQRTALINHAVTKGLNPDAPMKDSGVEWLGEIPRHWAMTTARYFYDVKLGKMLDSNKQNGNDLVKPYLRAANIHWNKILLDEVGVNEMEFSEPQLERYALQSGDLLVTEGGVTVGRSAIWNGELTECYFQNSLNRARPSKHASTKWLYYWMYFVTNNGFIDILADKSTFGHLTNEKLKALPIPIPPVSEHNEIIAKLEGFEPKMKAQVALIERQIELLKEYRTALISEAVTGKIDVREWKTVHE